MEGGSISERAYINRRTYRQNFKAIPQEGAPRKIGRGFASPLPKTLTLFMTKICDVNYPIYDLTRNLKPS